MRTIEIDDDVYAHLVTHTSEIGESASSILRRLLSLGTASSPGADESSGADGLELSDYLDSAEFKRLRNVKERFVAILGELHSRDPQAFSSVLQIEGRKRKYFAESRSEIESSGRSVAPRSIPGSSYWVMTNASTEYKKTLLRRVMEQLGYSRRSANAAAAALR